MRLLITSLAVIGLGLLMGAAAYESVVMAPNYAARVPESLEHLRGFFVATAPSAFGRVIAPAAGVVLVLTVVLAWRTPARWWLVAALAALAIAEVITVTFRHPRDELLFARPLESLSLAEVESAARQWGPGSHVRVLLLAGAMAWALGGLIVLAREDQ